jgi:lactate dehydrogenase-like 2-hydroxyacid dehydrogenase
MNKPRIWITRKLSDATLERAQKDYEVEVNLEDQPGTKEEIISASFEFDAIVPCHSEVFSSDVVSNFGPRLKIIANHSVGVDHCDLVALKEKNILVTNTPDVLSDATAEIAMLLMLGAARHAVLGDEIVRTGNWKNWSPSFMVGKQLTGSRIGIIGMGRVGQAFAKKARGFDMDIHYFNRTKLSDSVSLGATYHDTIESLLKVSDFLSLHCPATPETKLLIDAQRLNIMPFGAILVNTARGSLIDEEAGLDCYQDEPGGNPKFSNFKNIFMLPHIGSATVKTRDSMGFRALDNLDSYFAGKTPEDLL